MESRKFDHEVLELLTERLTFTFPRGGPRNAPTYTRPSLHQDFRFVRVEMAGENDGVQVSILFSWITSPDRTDIARFELGRFTVDEHPLDVELCVSFIMQQLEEDLCGGHAPIPANEPGHTEYGIHYALGR